MTFGRSSSLAIGVLLGLALGLVAGTFVGLRLGPHVNDRAKSRCQLPVGRSPRLQLGSTGARQHRAARSREHRRPPLQCRPPSCRSA